MRSLYLDSLNYESWFFEHGYTVYLVKCHRDCQHFTMWINELNKQSTTADDIQKIIATAEAVKDVD